MLTGAAKPKRKPDMVDKIILFGGAALVGWVSVGLLGVFFGLGTDASFAGQLFAFFR